MTPQNINMSNLQYETSESKLIFTIVLISRNHNTIMISLFRMTCRLELKAFYIKT